MQDWDTRIENLKANIANARKKWILPYVDEVIEIKEDEKKLKKTEELQDSKVLDNEEVSKNEVLENSKPLNELSQNKEKEELNAKLDEKDTSKLLNEIEKANSVPESTVKNQTTDEAIIEEVDIANEEVKVEGEGMKEYAITSDDIQKELSKIDETKSSDTVNEEVKVEGEDMKEYAITSDDIQKELSTIDETKSSDELKDEVEQVQKKKKALDKTKKTNTRKGKNKLNQVKPDIVDTELAQLESINENDLSEEQEDRMYELRRIRAQRNLQKENQAEFDIELKKADEEISALKSELGEKPKLPKGYVE